MTTEKPLTAQEAGKRVDNARSIAAKKAKDLKAKTTMLERAQDADRVAKVEVAKAEESLRQVLRG